MDAAGKDCAIKSVFEGVNPQGCEVTSFKQPSTKELDHDFLWRSMIALPERGRIGIFNRSYYEECLVVRVHPEILAKQKIPPKLVTKDIWRDRFEDISAMERYLARNGTVILKFFLNVSKEEQRERFLERLEEPAKNWKFSLADIGERKLWDKYQAAYQDMIRHTSTKQAPWHVVPADHKWFARVVIGSAIVGRARQARSAFPESRQGRPQRIQAGPRGAAGGGEGHEEVGWVERSDVSGAARYPTKSHPSSFPAKAGNPVRCGLSAPTPASGILGHPPARVTTASGLRIRSPILTIFWHCGRPQILV